MIMTDVNLELKKAIINHAYQKNDITKVQYEEMLKVIHAELEEQRLQKKLKEYSDQEFLKKYTELSSLA